MRIEIRYAWKRHIEDRNVEVEFFPPEGGSSVMLVSLDDLALLRDMAATFISGQELEGAEIARIRKATNTEGNSQSQSQGGQRAAAPLEDQPSHDLRAVQRDPGVPGGSLPDLP